MNIFWENNPDGYAVATLASPGTVLATARTDHGAAVTFYSEWIPEGGGAGSVIVESDGYQARIIQGENAGQGLLVLWAAGGGDFSPEITLMVLGASTGAYEVAAGGDQPGETAEPEPVVRDAPANISGSISALDRIIIEFDPVTWENELDFVYRFTFQRGTDAPITMDKAWGVLTTGDGRRRLYSQLIGLTIENCAEWVVTIQGVSSLGTGDTSAPFVLQPEAASALLSFSMDNTAQISWVFDDWQNAAPLEVETRIDGGPWLPTFVTDESRTNAELYGDDCIVGDDWTGGVLGVAHYHWRFDNQTHTVEARARIDGTADSWLYSEAQNIPLRSLYVPVASWGTVSFSGANGLQALPAPTITLQRPDDYDGYLLSVVIDGGPEIPWRDLDFSTVYRTSVTPMDLVALAGAEQRDGGEHAISLFLDVVQESDAVHRYDFGVTNVVIPLAEDLGPAPPVWSAKVFLPEDGASTAAVLHLETAARVLMDIAAVVEVDGVTVPSSEIAVTVYAQALTTARYNIEIPAADGYTHVIRCTLTLTSPITGESTTQSTPAVSFIRETAKPATPTAITATLLRQAADGLPDQIQLDWIADTLVQLLAIIDGRTRIIAYADSTEHTLRLENLTRLLPRDGGLHSIRFGVRGYQAGRVGDARLSASVDLSAYAPLPEPEPVPITLFSELIESVATSAGVTTDTAEIIIRNGLRQIKAVVAKGGSVSLDYFGEYSAAWSNEVRVPKFKIGDAFKSGVLQGVVIP
jgi:hypothetical protein